MPLGADVVSLALVWFPPGALNDHPRGRWRLTTSMVTLKLKRRRPRGYGPHAAWDHRLCCVKGCKEPRVWYLQPLAINGEAGRAGPFCLEHGRLVCHPSRAICTEPESRGPDDCP